MWSQIHNRARTPILFGDKEVVTVKAALHMMSSAPTDPPACAGGALVFRLREHAGLVHYRVPLRKQDSAYDA